MVQTVTLILAILTLLSNIGIIVFLLLLGIEKVTRSSFLSPLKLILNSYSYIFMFIITLTATLGSLFYSEIAKLTPCVLCWYQRIMMYPQPLLLYVGIARNERVLKPYLLTLNIIGFSIALYHYTLQRFPEQLLSPCSVVGASTSCIKGYTFSFGYISIPFMALTAFALNILLLIYSTSTVTKEKAVAADQQNDRTRNVKQKKGRR